MLPVFGNRIRVVNPASCRVEEMMAVGRPHQGRSSDEPGGQQ
jgi:hypothetical protein